MKLKFKLEIFIFRGVELFSYVRYLFTAMAYEARLLLGRKEIVMT